MSNLTTAALMAAALASARGTQGARGVRGPVGRQGDPGAAGAAGAAGGAGLYNVNAPALVPHALDDELLVLDPKWTAFGPTAPVVTHPGDGCQVELPGSYNGWGGRQQVVPGDAFFAITVRMRFMLGVLNWTSAGLFIAEDLTASPATANMLCGTIQANAGGALTMTVLERSSPGAHSGFGIQRSAHDATTCLRMVADVANTRFYLSESRTGERGSWSRLTTTGSDYSALLPAGIGSVGFGGWQFTVQPTRSTWNNFQYTPLTGVTDDDTQFALGR